MFPNSPIQARPTAWGPGRARQGSPQPRTLLAAGATLLLLALLAVANPLRATEPVDAGAIDAGATADAFTLFERLEGKLEQYPKQLTRACVELAKDWRTDRYLRRLEAMMAVADKNVSLVLTGTGDVLEPEDGLIGIGSGGNFALAAARALIDRDDMEAEAIARKAMEIAAGICVYTNTSVVIETL